MSDDEQNLLAIYRKLHDMLSEAIEEGRITDADIPDDYDAIVTVLIEAAQVDSRT